MTTLEKQEKLQSLMKLAANIQEAMAPAEKHLAEFQGHLEAVRLAISVLKDE